MVTLVLLGDTTACFAMQLLIRMGTEMELKRGRAKRPQAELAGGWLSSPSYILREAYAT